MPNDKKQDPIRQTDDGAIRLAKTLARTAHYAALAVLDPETGHPIATRVAVATASDGAPVILVSSLSAHTKGLQADARCSLLVGEPGKGDPLAHPRLTILANARFLNRTDDEREAVAGRYLRRNPKAKLYADFGDFSFVRLEPISANLNGGFGKAYKLTREQLLDDASASLAIGEIEGSAIAHMNSDHPNAVQSIGLHASREVVGNWKLAGIDSTGMDLVSAETSARAWFLSQADNALALRNAIKALSNGDFSSTPDI